MAFSKLSRRVEPAAWLSFICALAMLAHDTADRWVAQAATPPVGMTIIATPPRILSPVDIGCAPTWDATSIRYLAPPPAPQIGDVQ